MDLQEKAQVCSLVLIETSPGTFDVVCLESEETLLADACRSLVSKFLSNRMKAIVEAKERGMAEGREGKVLMELERLAEEQQHELWGE